MAIHCPSSPHFLCPPVEAIKFGLKERRIFVGSEEGEINCINAASRPKKRAFFFCCFCLAKIIPWWPWHLPNATLKRSMGERGIIQVVWSFAAKRDQLIIGLQMVSLPQPHDQLRKELVLSCCLTQIKCMVCMVYVAEHKNMISNIVLISFLESPWTIWCRKI